MKVLRGSTLLIALLLLGLLLYACGGDSSPTQQSNNSNNGTPTATVPGSKTANPFFTPEGGPTTVALPSYTLEFDFKPGVPVIDASITTPLPTGQANDWSVTIDGSGKATLTLNPKAANGGASTSHTLTQAQINDLLQKLNGLGVPQWPDTTPPEKLAAGGASRSLHLYLKGRTKAITDLSGGNGDALTQMLNLIQKTVNDAPAAK